MIDYKNSNRWEDHLIGHEEKRAKFGLPSMKEQKCAACDRGLVAREERLAQASSS